MPYEIFCESVQGASHIKKGMQCEDAGSVIETEDCKIFVLGDGHGDSACPRSRIGSEVLCKIATDELSVFAETINHERWEEKLFNKTEADGLIIQLITSIFGKWSCAINEDYIQSPLTEEELANCGSFKKIYLNGERIEHIYGTTFIAGVLTNTYLLLLQQGDGRCVVFDYDGNATQPIPWDDRCFANVTTSVCDADAVQSCRYCVINQQPNQITACFAGSDGVEDSFPGNMERMHSYYRGLIEYACENQIDGLKKYLQQTLPDFSRNGSGDDTTICGILDLDHASTLLEKFSSDNKIVLIKDEIKRTDERLSSMEPKLQYLQNKSDAINKEYSDVKSKYDDILLEKQRIENDLATFEMSISQPSKKDSVIENIKDKVLSEVSVQCLKKRLETLSAEKDKIEKTISEVEEKKKIIDEDFIPYKDKYNGFLKVRNDAIQELKEQNVQTSHETSKLSKYSMVGEQDEQ